MNRSQFPCIRQFIHKFCRNGNPLGTLLVYLGRRFNYRYVLFTLSHYMFDKNGNLLLLCHYKVATCLNYLKTECYDLDPLVFLKHFFNSYFLKTEDYCVVLTREGD